VLSLRPWWRLRRALWRQPLVGCGGILLYHRITDLPHDPWSLAVSPARFDAQLAVLKREAVCLPLAEFLARRAAGTLPRNAVTLTFDDGYADNLHVALPLLERHGVPATLFVMTDFINSPSETWWDRLEQVIQEVPALPPSLAFSLGGQSFRWSSDDAPDAGTRDRLRVAVAEALAAHDTPAREAALAELWRQLGMTPRLRPSHRGLDLAELRQLAASPLITIGAHSRSHPHLARIDAARQLSELADSKTALEQWLDRPIELVAYPHGSVDATTERLAARLGFGWGFTSVERIVPHRFRPLRLPRIEVPDLDSETMSKLLHIFGISRPGGSFARAAVRAVQPGALPPAGA
jgi:peptidoglycan/xylan/chitin deacetylase (PgdA/CDA1 family)